MIAALKKFRPRPLSRAYLQLVRRFPLSPIVGEVEYEQASEILQDLFGRDDVDADVRGYVDTLSMLIQAYDREHCAPSSDRRSPARKLKYLLEQSGMNVTELGRIMGSQPAASMALAGKRELSKDHIRRLADYFKVDAGYFL